MNTKAATALSKCPKVEASKSGKSGESGLKKPAFLLAFLFCLCYNREKLTKNSIRKILLVCDEK